MKYTIALLLLVFLQLQASAQRVRFDLYSAMDGQMELSDGVYTNFWGYGFVGEEMTMPAPKLVVQTGDTVDVVMFNVSNESHTIHLHGLDVDQVNDGVPQTSFYVITGDSATYSFVAKYPGTYLYHCHVTTTQHLTMGMYGMLVVKEPGGVLYAGGPAYQHERDFLFSDLEVRVNDAPLAAFPFHTIRPDHFMVNGLSGAQLEQDQSMRIEANAGEQVALRLGNIGYTVVRCVFPPGANATVHMSDGRVLPQAFESGTLEIYPGERFSVLLAPDVDITGSLQVDHYSMLDGTLQGSNAIPVGVGIRTLPGRPSWRVAPNPAQDAVVLTVGDDGGLVRWIAADGRLVREDRLVYGVNRIDLSGMAPGLYMLHGAQGFTSRIVVQ